MGPALVARSARGAGQPQGRCRGPAAACPWGSTAARTGSRKGCSPPPPQQTRTPSPPRKNSSCRRGASNCHCSAVAVAAARGWPLPPAAAVAAAAVAAWGRGTVPCVAAARAAAWLLSVHADLLRWAVALATAGALRRRGTRWVLPPLQARLRRRPPPQRTDDRGRGTAETSAGAGPAWRARHLTS